MNERSTLAGTLSFTHDPSVQDLQHLWWLLSQWEGVADRWHLMVSPTGVVEGIHIIPPAWQEV